MNHMTSRAAFRLTRATMHDKASVDIISYVIGDCNLGRVLIARSVSGVCAILIGGDNGELEADLAGRFPKSRLVAKDDRVHDDLAKVIR
jgi:AraC family transcriptional regulator, regulatory protein of adaptative response / methylated-DNA-[protein]-cysteine methyltransferase